MASSFAEALAVAARELHAAAREIRGSGGIGAGAGGSAAAGVFGAVSGGRSAVALPGPAGIAAIGAGVALDALDGARRFLTPAANAFATTGTSQGVASAVNQSLIGAVGSTAIGGLLLAGSGVAAAQETTQRAAGRVGAVTEDLARYGVEIADDFRKRLADVSLEQETRVGKERGKVQELLGSTDALEKARPEGAGATFDAMLSVLRSIESKIVARGGAP